jgi:D-lactate dehydrogenase
MKIAVFSTKNYDRDSLTAANSTHNHELCFFETQLDEHTAPLAKGIPVVCPFVNDVVNTAVLNILADQGTRLLALRSAGFNNVDLPVAAELGIAVVRVPAYSPYAVLGFDLHGSTIGIIGTGKIGMVFAQIMHGFGCTLLGYDKFPNPKFEGIGAARYVDLPELMAHSDVISLHCPLTPENHYLIDAGAIAQMKPGVMLINTSRGGLVDTEAVIAGIKSAQIGYLGIDVYEQEADLFSEDLSGTIIQDDNFQLLKSFPNVVVTAHQAFFTRNALQGIAETTLANVAEFEQGRSLTNQL